MSLGLAGALGISEPHSPQTFWPESIFLPHTGQYFISFIVEIDCKKWYKYFKEEVEDIFETKPKGKKAAISEFDDENFYGDEGFNEDEFDDESFSDLSFDDDINSY